MQGNILNPHLNNVFVFYKSEIEDNNKKHHLPLEHQLAFSKMQEAMDEEASLVNGQMDL